MSKLNQMMTNASRNRSENAEQQKPSEWNSTCCASGCPLSPSVKKEGLQICSFHVNTNPNHWQSITRSIRLHARYINKQYEMTRWGVIEWKQKAPLIANWKFCPMTPDDEARPTLYLQRLTKEISKSVADKAAEFYGEQAL